MEESTEHDCMHITKVFSVNHIRIKKLRLKDIQSMKLQQAILVNYKMQLQKANAQLGKQDPKHRHAYNSG